MKKPEKSAPEIFRPRGARLRVPAGIPRPCRLPGDLGRGCFAAAIQLPPEDDCPVIRATFAEHAILFGLLGDVLLGNDGGEVVVSPGGAFGLLPAEYSLESVGHLAPMMLIMTLPRDAADQVFDRGLVSQLYLEMSNNGLDAMRAPAPLGNIHPLPQAAERVANLVRTLPFCGQLGHLIGAMGGLRDCGDLYNFLVRGPCAHRTGKPRGHYPECFAPFTQDSTDPAEPPLSPEEEDRLLEQIRLGEERLQERIRRNRETAHIEVTYPTPTGPRTELISPMTA